MSLCFFFTAKYRHSIECCNLTHLSNKHFNTNIEGLTLIVYTSLHFADKQMSQTPCRVPGSFVF